VVIMHQTDKEHEEQEKLVPQVRCSMPKRAVYTVQLHVIQRTVLLSQFYLFVRLQMRVL